MSRLILAAVAHADDVELSFGGSIAKWVREGDHAELLVVTDGARGAKFPGKVAALTARRRRAEQEEAASALGFDDATFLDFPDGGLRDDEVLHERLVREIRTRRPDVVVILDPLTVIYQDSYVNHRDHRMLGMAMLDAMYPEASNAGYFPEQIEQGLPLHKVPETLLATTERPNFWVDVSETIDIRFDALRAHRSQMALWPDGGEAVIAQQRDAARQGDESRGMTYAEAFRRILANPLT